MAQKEKVLKLNEFLEEFKDALVERVVSEYPPLYQPEEARGKYVERLGSLKRKPFGAQADLESLRIGPMLYCLGSR